MNIQADWTLPSVAADQRALAYSLVEMRSDPGLPFQEVSRPAAPLATVTLADIAPGTYELRVTAVDVSGAAGVSASASITLATVPVFRAPGAITGLTLTQT